MEKTTPPIKTDLFRFVTFRTPEELSYQDREIRFVVHPDITKSVINSCPVRTGNDTTLRKFDNFLKKFPSFENKKKVREFNSILFDYANMVYKKKVPVEDITVEGNEGVKILSREDEIFLFDALLGEVTSKKSPVVRQSITQMLIVNHVLKNSSKLVELGLKKLTDIKIEIPYELIQCYKPWLFKDCGGSLDGVQNLGIADFRRVEQTVCCYVPGEVSHIENIMAKEYKERSTRNLVRTEDTFEATRETEVENLTDVASTARNELSSEIANVIEQNKDSGYGGSLGVSGEYFGATIDVNAYADFATSNSSSYSNTEAKEYAEEVTKKALERIVQKTSEKRTSKIIKEFEENNKHGFDNRGDDSKHVTGIYRWIDIIYKNRLVNYGKRLMVEFMVPEPAEFYKTMLKYNSLTSEETTTEEIEPPLTLESFEINKPGDITQLNLANAAAYFGVTVNPLPAATLTLTKSLAPLAPVDHNRNINSQTLSAITVPADYEADTITGSYTYEYRANSASSSQQAFCDFTFGGNIVNSGKDYSGSKKNKTVSINEDLNPNLSGTIPVSASYSGCFGFYGAISIQCVLKQSVIDEWQNTAYNLLLAAYNDKLSEYNEEVNVGTADDGIAQFYEEEGVSPFVNRITEQRELKRICIEMLMKPFCNIQGRDNNTDTNACDLYQIPQVNQTEEFSSYTRTVKFFEQAIDWKLMSYLFYPYYWADKCDWAELMNNENDDVIFQAFLQSGMARVVVPIRTQFTASFAYYLETGDIWSGNDLVAGSEDDLYLSISEDLLNIENPDDEDYELEWETRVPTSLAIIQGKSAFLEEEGLPCCDIIENENMTTNIKMSDVTLDIPDTSGE